jgi:hypothetical protein
MNPTLRTDLGIAAAAPFAAAVAGAMGDVPRAGWSATWQPGKERP